MLLFFSLNKSSNISLQKIGYDYGQEIFQEWAKSKRSDLFPDLATISSSSRPEVWNIVSVYVITLCVISMEVMFSFVLVCVFV
jgi:hypothetical protein